ncbi:MAG: hypothetical protein ACI8TX_003490, partial [Hyphomicrobiaceae bacterium]
GMSANVSLGALPDQRYAARVREIATQAGADTTYPVTVALNDPGHEVREGMDGEATVAIPNPDGPTTAVPLACVIGASGGATYVWVVGETAAGGEGEPPIATLHRRIVRTGNLRAGDRIEIIDGLNEGERIVSRGVNRVEDGQLATLMADEL